MAVGGFYADEMRQMLTPRPARHLPRRVYAPRVVRLRTIRQHVLPDWLLRGFTRGIGEAGETTWCYTAEGVEATTLGLAGSYESFLEDPVPKMMVRSLEDHDHIYEQVIGILRTRKPEEFVDKPPVATHLVADYGLRVYTVRLVEAHTGLSRMGEFLALAKTVQEMPEWAEAMADDVERYGLDAVVQAACSRRPEKPHVRGERVPRYPGSAKTLIKFWKAIDAAADEAHIRVKLPDMTKLHERWKAKLARARYRVMECAPGSVILGDVGMLVRYKGKAGLHPFELERIAGVVAVFLPISSSRVLVASLDRHFDPTATSTDQLNRASSKWSERFFVASRRSTQNEELRSVLSADWERWAERELG